MQNDDGLILFEPIRGEMISCENINYMKKSWDFFEWEESGEKESKKFEIFS